MSEIDHVSIFILSLKYWHAYLAACFAFLCVGWVLTGVERMPEARGAFLVVIGMLIGIGFIFIAVELNNENMWGRTIASDVYRRHSASQ